LAIDICSNVRPKIIKRTPPVYEGWIKRCWDTDPNKRPTAKKLYQEVLNWLNEFDRDLSSLII